jgi:hypothetical protein
MIYINTGQKRYLHPFTIKKAANAREMLMKKPANSVLVPVASIVTGAIVFLILTGMLIPSFSPLRQVAAASSPASFNFVTNLFYYEASEVSFNMEDIYNSTHLYDFSGKNHLGAKSPSLQFESGIYGQALQWPTGEIVVEDLGIVSMSFTLEAWVFPSSGDALTLAGAGLSPGLPYPYITKAQNGSMRYVSTGGEGSLYSSQGVPLNAWTHVALVYDVTSGIAKWYLNAAEQGSRFVGGDRRWSGRWAIGRIGPGITTSEWKGKIDEFRIYKGVALSQSKIQEDMKTRIGHKLTVTGLTPNSDIAQLWYTDGEFARTHMLQQTADTEGKVEFNVYSWSGRTTPYNAIIRVSRAGRTYSSQTLRLNWEDVYNFSQDTNYTETVIAGVVSGLIIVIPIAILSFNRVMAKRRKA